MTDDSLRERWAIELAGRVWTEVFRHPGADPDDADEVGWAAVMRPVSKAICSGRTTVGRIDPDTGRMLTSAPVWAFVLAIRNHERRPTWAQVRSLAAQHLGVEYSDGATGEERAVRRVVTAPEPLALPAPQTVSSIDAEPSWLGRFPSMDSGGPFDRAMMLCLTKLPEGRAQETIDLIEAQRRERRRIAADRVVADAEKRQAKYARERGDDLVGHLLRRVAMRRAAT